MAYDEKLAERVRKALSGYTAVSEKRMFGGLCFLLRGNMCCGISGSELMVRVGPEQYQAALSRPHAREMDFTGRPLSGFVFVSSQGLGSPRLLQQWVDAGAHFAQTLPARGPASERRGRKS